MRKFVRFVVDAPITEFETWTLGATRASFPPSREDRRQPPRGGLVGLGDLEDEDRRHLAVLFAAGPAPPRPQSSTPSGRVRCRWHRHFCPLSPRIRDSPLPKNSTSRRGGVAHQWKGRKIPRHRRHRSQDSSPVLRGRIQEGESREGRYRSFQIMIADLVPASATTAALPLPASPV